MRLEAFVRSAAWVVCLGVCVGCADEAWPSSSSHGPDGGIRIINDVATGGAEGSADVEGATEVGSSTDGGAVSDVSIGIDGSITPEASTPTDAGAGEGSHPVATTCSTTRSSEPVPARTVATSDDAVVGDKVVYVGTELFGRFYNSCGSCHVDSDFGGLKLSQLDFKPASTRAGQNLLDRMQQENPALVMPPLKNGGTINSQRKPGDPVVQLMELFTQWLHAGQPADVFRVPRDTSTVDAGTISKYLMTPERGMALTNIGDCVPGVDTFTANPPSSRAADLDTMFAALKRAAPGSATSLPARIGLPERLADTDLTSFDASLLAQDRIVGYAPAYPLWSDNARKIRHVRVPLGTSIHFDKQTQTFDIPANTRFYKTFLKPVIEKGGNLRYRKVETRLIVARPDTQTTDGKTQNNSLFGTYLWDDLEREAKLVTETLNNGEPFKDLLLVLEMDEEKAESVRASTPATDDVVAALEKARATRKYAVPGSDRCVQCHMGSATKNFILGFFPLQVRRRATGEGGTVEPAGPDELTQLDRLIGYKIITGIDSAADITPLEDSQGARKPRNDYELSAQGYVLGNCSHCHNPRGFPSVENVVLRDVFNFLPNADPVDATDGCRKQGGLFQFPLGCSSPRILRGLGANIPMPYITPSLVDYPNDDGSSAFSKGEVLAPWRSLIYRNVDTPFTYADVGAIFPHMPMNVPGYDCRAPRILGEWMVSIPAVRTNNPQADETTFSDPTPQPYKEVKSSDATYARAITEAESRMERYQWGPLADPKDPTAPRFSRHAFCADTSNIQDPYVTLADRFHLAPPDENTFENDDPNGKIIMPDVGTPRRPHWVVTDLTLPNVDGWNPRRSDWMKVLFNDCLCNETKAECRNPDGKVNKAFACPNTDPAETDKKKAQVKVISVLKGDAPAAGVHLTDSFRAMASETVPFGLWQQRTDCSYTSPNVHTVGYYRDPANAAKKPKWIDAVAPRLPDTAPVYETSRGAAVFGMICINCHGAQADSHGRMADTLLTMTGGSTRVANLRDGLFGAGGANRAGAFQPAASADVTTDDWAVRYVSWMALGGTNKLIPLPVLNIVGNTLVLGAKRNGVGTPADPNMLETAKNLCRYVLPAQISTSGGSAPATFVGVFDPVTASFDYLSKKDVPLITSNGDLELWQRLCVLGNSRPVRALFYTDKTGNPSQPAGLTPGFLMRPDLYPATAPVGNHLGKIEIGVQPSNELPWCWGDTSGNLSAALKYAQDHAIDGQPLPQCPPGFGSSGSEDNQLTAEEQEAWATRGAINAGLSVFVYLDGLTRLGKAPVPSYTDCPAP